MIFQGHLGLTTTEKGVTAPTSREKDTPAGSTPPATAEEPTIFQPAQQKSPTTTYSTREEAPEEPNLPVSQPLKKRAEIHDLPKKTGKSLLFTASYKLYYFSVSQIHCYHYYTRVLLSSIRFLTKGFQVSIHCKVSRHDTNHCSSLSIF